MKVGSIVECIDNKHFGQLAPTPKLRQPYTVSWIGEATRLYSDGTKTKDRGKCIQLAEIDSGNKKYGMDCFRELLSPMEIQSALDSSIPVLIEI